MKYGHRFNQAAGCHNSPYRYQAWMHEEETAMCMCENLGPTPTRPMQECSIAAYSIAPVQLAHGAVKNDFGL